VSHSRVPEWKRASVDGICYHEHLYNRIVGGGESDQIERWFDREFESPAERVLEKATTDRPLSRDEWMILIRFLGAQDVRTPLRMKQSIERWNRELPDFMDRTLSESVKRWVERQSSAGGLTQSQAIKPSREFRRAEAPPYHEPFPVRTAIEPSEVEGYANVKVEILNGRALWLYGVRHLLSTTLRALEKHRWTIVKPPRGMLWLTSDNPVVKLNYYGEGRYDFGGGWGNPKTDLLLPLSPKHLMCTQVGAARRELPERGAELDEETALKLQGFIAENADRMIFSSSPDSRIGRLRPREVDAEKFNAEKKRWEEWPREQAAGEARFLKRCSETRRVCIGGE
jgi:hypothetical protein